jgi:hypothetical protein
VATWWSPFVDAPPRDLAPNGINKIHPLRHHPDFTTRALGVAVPSNSLFAGSDEGGENWACLASLVETCKLNHVNPQAYFTDLLTRLVNGWPQNRIDELMPWHWAPKQPS